MGREVFASGDRERSADYVRTSGCSIRGGIISSRDSGNWNKLNGWLCRFDNAGRGGKELRVRLGMPMGLRYHSTKDSCLWWRVILIGFGDLNWMRRVAW